MGSEYPTRPKPAISRFLFWSIFYTCKHCCSIDKYAYSAIGLSGAAILKIIIGLAGTVCKDYTTKKNISWLHLKPICQMLVAIFLHFENAKKNQNGFSLPQKNDKKVQILFKVCIFKEVKAHFYIQTLIRGHCIWLIKCGCKINLIKLKMQRYSNETKCLKIPMYISFYRNCWHL